MSAVRGALSGLALAPPPAVALDGPAVARLAEECGALESVSGGEDLGLLAELARELAAAGAGNILIPHVVLPALLAPGMPVDGATTVALGEGEDDLCLDSGECRLEAGTLDGGKPLVSGAASHATRALVAAATADGPALVRVELDADGVDVEPVATIGRGADANLRFSAVEVGAGAVVAELGELAERLAAARPLLALVQAAEGRGMLAQMLELAVRQGRERHAFGRPVGSFQAFQHACADIAMDLELAAALVDHAAAVPSAESAVTARLFVAEAVVAGSRSALQLQGGAGFLDDHPVARLYRQAKESQLRWGSSEQQLDSVWQQWTGGAAG